MVVKNENRGAIEVDECQRGCPAVRFVILKSCRRHGVNRRLSRKSGGMGFYARRRG